MTADTSSPPDPADADAVRPQFVIDPVARTGQGRVRGVLDRDLVHWRGIPFAAPPVGDRRFRAPEPPQDWPGIRDASKYGPVAPQRITGPSAGAGVRTRQEESCLYLNVTAPAAAADPRPVMVFIHGGAYIIGAGSSWMYEGSALARDGDVVYVSINYRLGALGYLDLREFGSAERRFEANLGLRDQIRALEWVRDNIAAFGGDPNNVTIFGESAGGMAVTTLLATPSAHGLFHRAIAQSPAPAVVNTTERADELAAAFVALLRDELGDRAPADDTGLLAGAPVTALRKASGRLLKASAQALPGIGAMTCVVDGDLLPKHPFEAFADGSAADVPTIFGTNLNEGTLFFLIGLIPTKPEEIEAVFAASDPDAASRVLAQYEGYPGRNAAIAAGGDLVFWAPTVHCAEQHSDSSPTWMYRYDVVTPGMRAARLGAMHSAELPGLFDNSKGPILRLLSIGERHAMLQAGRRMREHWVTFARDGAPAAGWPAYERTERNTLVFDLEDHVEQDPQRLRREAWQGYRYAR